MNYVEKRYSQEMKSTYSLDLENYILARTSKHILARKHIKSDTRTKTHKNLTFDFENL